VGVSLAYGSNVAEFVHETWGSNKVHFNKGLVIVNGGVELSKRASGVELFTGLDLKIGTSVASGIEQKGSWSYRRSDDSLSEALDFMNGVGGSVEIGARLLL